MTSGGNSWRRRDVLRLLGASAAGAACGDTKPPPPCVVPGIAVADQSYCLVTGEVLRVPGVRTIGLGQAALFNQCCLVALCGDDALVDVAQTVDNTTRA